MTTVRCPEHAHPQVEEKRSVYEVDCAHCRETIPPGILHFQRHVCGCHFHSHCLVLVMIKYGVTDEGLVYCRGCLSVEGDSDYAVDNSSQE